MTTPSLTAPTTPGGALLDILDGMGDETPEAVVAALVIHATGRIPRLLDLTIEHTINPADLSFLRTVRSAFDRLSVTVDVRDEDVVAE